MTYNLTAIGASNNTLEVLQTVNTNILDGFLGIGITIIIWVILFSAFQFKTGMPVKSGTAASFIVFVLTLLLFSMEILPVYMIWVFLILTALGVAFWKLD